MYDQTLGTIEPSNTDLERDATPDSEDMLALLSSDDPEQQTIAARAFGNLSDDRAIAPLIALLESSSPETRVSAAYALGRNTSPDAIDPLIRCLSDGDSDVRKGAVWALGNCGDLRALMPLVETLRDDSVAVRLWSASSLGQLAKVGYDFAVAAVPPLLVGLRTDPVAAVRSNCAWSLGQLCRELPSNVVYAGAIDGLLDAFEEDEDVGVRQDARSSLLRVGDPRGMQAIEDAENDELEDGSWP
ncbi:MAG: HEAT repeat domain-containing protein [Geitlerinemataceae cyanobacterium]